MSESEAGSLEAEVWSCELEVELPEVPLPIEPRRFVTTAAPISPKRCGVLLSLRLNVSRYVRCRCSVVQSSAAKVSMSVSVVSV